MVFKHKNSIILSEILYQNLLMIIPEKLTSKILNNAFRIFENKLTRPQTKAIKVVLRWIRKKATTVISQLHENEEIKKDNFAEKISYHLWNVDLLDIVENKSLLCVNKIIDEKKVTLISYDESDIFKPDAKHMPWLMKVRDWSTGLTWNGYVFRWVNVNWVSLFSNLEAIQENWVKLKKWEKTIQMVEKVRKALPNNNWIYLIDRWWDDITVIKNLYENNDKFVIRMKKNRNVIDVKSKKIKKISKFEIWVHDIQIEWLKLKLHIFKRKWFRDSILLITNDETLESKFVLEYYLKRRKIEEDFNKMKDLWIEEIRLLSWKKITNVLALAQFVIVLAQDVYNEVMKRLDMTYQEIYLYFKKYCERKCLTLNPQSFIKFISHWLKDCKFYNTCPEPINSLFWGKRQLKKLGVI